LRHGGGSRGSCNIKAATFGGIVQSTRGIEQIGRSWTARRRLRRSRRRLRTEFAEACITDRARRSGVSQHLTDVEILDGNGFGLASLETTSARFRIPISSTPLPSNLGFVRSLGLCGMQRAIQLSFDGLNLANDLGDDFPLIQGRKERCRIGQDSSRIMEGVYRAPSRQFRFEVWIWFQT